MIANTIEIPGKFLDKFPTALSDSRMEKIWFQLRKEMNLPDVVDFASYVQPPQEIEKEVKGVHRLLKLPEQVVFLVVSPNPQKRWKGKLIKSFAFTTVEDWHAAEKEAKHYAGREDPAVDIFRGLCRQHLAARKNWEDMQ